MKVALDGAGISPRMTGVGRYFHRLLEELIPLDPTIGYTLFLKKPFDIGFDFPNLRTTVLQREGSYFFWQNTLLRKAIQRGGYDFFWSPNYTIPFFLSTRSWVTIHDMSWKSLPGDYSAAERLYKNIASRPGLKKAEIIFTDSDFSKGEIRRYAAVPEEKIRRIHLGVDSRFHRATPDEVAGFKSRYGLAGKRPIGFLGSFFRRRHVGEIIAAFKILQERHPETVLLLAGENPDTRTPAQKPESPNIRWLGRLPEGEINAFYSSLSLFLYLSEYEGFGLPPLEAMSCGTLSLLLRRSSLAELYGDIALFIDRPDPRLIADAIADFLQREERFKVPIFNRWQDRKTYFSWKRAAAEYHREIGRLS